MNRNRKFHILLLTSSFPRYEGDYFGPWILEYAREYVRQGHKVTVVTPQSENFISDIQESDLLKIVRFDYFLPRRWQKSVKPPGMMPQIKLYPWLLLQIPFLLIFYYLRVRKILNQDNTIDIIHSQWAIPAGFIGGLMTKKFAKPHFITTQGAELYLSKFHPFRPFVRWSLTSAIKIFPVSEQMATRLGTFEIHENRIRVIPNTVNTDKFSPDVPTDLRAKWKIPIEALIILTVRRLVPEKNVEELINVFGQLTNDINVDMYLVIVGDGPEKIRLEQLSRSLSSAEKIRFIGFVNNDLLPSIYAASDIYVLNSHQEGLSLSLLEAMSSGLIVLSRKSVGGEDVIDHGYNGFMYSDETELVLLLQEIYKNEDEKNRNIKMSARQKIVKSFSLSTTIPEYCKEYTQA